MKRLLFYISIFAIMLSGCKSHKKAVVAATPEFNAEQTWQLAEMRGKEFSPLEGQKKITIQINPEAGTFSGCSGCNRYFGNFKDLGNGRMELTEFNGTKMACPEAFHKVESSFMQLLHRCNVYKLDEYSLKLLQDDKVLLSFEKMEQ